MDIGPFPRKKLLRLYDTCIPMLPLDYTRLAMCYCNVPFDDCAKDSDYVVLSYLLSGTTLFRTKYIYLCI